MRDGPDIALIGSLIGDPARANMLTALMSGKALTASELAAEAGITPQTASSHLSKLTDAGLVSLRKQGRHRYFALADNDVGAALESLMGLAAKKGHLRTRTGPRDQALRKARLCYDHLAGDLGVRIYDSLLAQGHLCETDDGRLELTDAGQKSLTSFGIDMDKARLTKGLQCRSCLDWSERRYHLAGSVGRAILTRLKDLGWAQTSKGSRLAHFSGPSEQALLEQFPLANPE
ncbi:ArsR/SmtB family transcription factor [Roseibium algae]|uniref:Winged helix-turn-helix domain-containing protein n=1 Tax=Roseibium algae TaxID=3123038 RepID=A0ABU8TI63_9HYPH